MNYPPLVTIPLHTGDHYTGNSSCHWWVISHGADSNTSMLSSRKHNHPGIKTINPLEQLSTIVWGNIQGQLNQAAYWGSKLKLYTLNIYWCVNCTCWMILGGGLPPALPPPDNYTANLWLGSLISDYFRCTWVHLCYVHINVSPHYLLGHTWGYSCGFDSNFISTLGHLKLWKYFILKLYLLQ